MRKYWFVTVVLVTLAAVYAFADDRLPFPSEKHAGPPSYAQISYSDEFGLEIYHTEEWAAIPFYRNPSCVPDVFNLLEMFDVPRAFGCDLTINGFEIFPVPPPDGGGPIQGKYWGLGAVPIYFVEWWELRTAVSDNVLTIRELTGLQTLQMGSASFFSVVLHPSGSPARVPHIEISARGVLQDGRQFQFQVAGGDQSALIKHIKIVFW